jgi:hypothetical protein
MTRVKLAVAAFFLFFVPLSFAQNPSDGNALLHQCSLVLRVNDGQDMPSPIDNLSAGVCMGLVRGIADTMSLWQSLDHGPVDMQADNTASHP